MRKIERRDQSMIYPKLKIDETVNLKFNIGSVKFYNAEKGYGFIERQNQDDLFFHAAQYRDVELDKEAFKLRLLSPKAESVMVETKRRVEDWLFDDPDDYLDLDDGRPVKAFPPARVKRQQWVIKPPRLPRTGDVVSYVEGYRTGRNQALTWFYSNDYPIAEMRQELDRIYQIHCDEIDNLPLLKLDRRVIVYGEPRANNVKKCFEKTVASDTTVTIFHGNNVDMLKQVYTYHKTYNDTYKPDTVVKYKCFAERANQTTVIEIPN